MRRRSHGTGRFEPHELAACGEGCVFEAEVLVFHPDRVWIGRDVYVGHRAILKGHHAGEMRIGDGTWIGQQCFLHAAGNLTFGANVGVGPGVRILTSAHREAGRDVPILHAPIERSPVMVEDDADLGVGAVILPGVTVGRGAQVGAGAVVTRDVPPYAVVAGNPARVLRERPR
ncbi:MAG TPA: acyltransferase [Sandaracinaceae bacterium LLY-WYZ-13_1]|nr:acyltransferase [Sandaracinaceae bacterium LLY-WYZ-13_1]